MWTDSRLGRRLGLRFPIIQAPMAGGHTTPALVAAVSNAGGLGSLAAAALEPDAIEMAVDAVRRETNRAFAVNLFVGADVVPIEAAIARLHAAIAPYHAALGIDPPSVPARVAPDWRAQFAAVIAARPAVLSFTFGCPEPALIAATTVAKAEALAAAGCDAVSAQGSEAGAHRGTFLEAPGEALVGTIALVPQIVDALGALPVIAAGGIADGRGIVAARVLGADAVQIGTAFMPTPEAGTPPVWKDAVAGARDDTTRVTRAFTGRYARAIVNRYLAEVGPIEEALPPYPVTNAITGPLRAKAAEAGAPEFMSLWAGQAAPLARVMPAGRLVETLAAEADAVAARLGERVASP
ncbi:MAG: nitronate monooxygenase [Alphaproteobacteria bacterium]|nr:nitronate monooxygenase [Alphaproteobacteria bacterium]